MNHTLPKVTFFHVKDNQQKMKCICHLVQQGMEKEKKILIVVPNEEAVKYIDSLLWRIPEESFTPHAVVNKSTKEWVAISQNISQNLNEAACLLNLCGGASPIPQNFEEIFELFDETHPQKIQQSQTKIKEYQAKGLVVVEI